MPEHGLAKIDTAVQETNRWLERVGDGLDMDDKKYAYQVLRAVLTTLRDRLPVELGANLGDQLPVFVRGIYYEGYVPLDLPQKYRRAADWKQVLVERADNMDIEQAELASQAVFALLRAELDSGIVDKVLEALPEEVRPVLEP